MDLYDFALHLLYEDQNVIFCVKDKTKEMQKFKDYLFDIGFLTKIKDNKLRFLHTNTYIEFVTPKLTGVSPTAVVVIESKAKELFPDIKDCIAFEQNQTFFVAEF